MKQFKFTNTVTIEVKDSEDIEEAKEKFADNSFDFAANAECEEVNGKVVEEENLYALVPWPDVQEYMDELWFDKEAKMVQYQSSYFIPVHRL